MAMQLRGSGSAYSFDREDIEACNLMGKVKKTMADPTGRSSIDLKAATQVTPSAAFR